jgi:menaquinol-cytochrome c reductase iron-sulfur subunit
MSENDPENMNRRGALSLIVGLLAGGWSLAAAGLAGLFATTPLRAVVPNKEALLGTKDIFDTDYKAVQLSLDIQDGWHRRTDQQMVYARKDDNGDVEVLSARCTHLGCTVRWNSSEGHFACPCHEGTFAADGEVLGGAPTIPLAKLETTTRGDDIFVKLA